ncbi:MAG: T9SS type A sorting domain-containing protein, partial [Saprospiraceae bacterium]|nr:T9SS type A sorting domain-containing protein [Saprospiraceae bacterium]
RLGDDAIVYPNPSNGSFEIKTLWQSGLLRIFDYRGQTVKKVILQSDREKYSFSLDPGLYFAVVEHNGVFKPLGKIVVER